MLIEFKNIFVEREGRQTLADLSLSLSERRIGIIGPNGSGKSTFIRLINGLLIPQVGQVRVDGLDTRHEVEKIRRKVGFVFQNPDNQIVFPVVSEDIEFGLKRRVPEASTRRLRIRDALSQLGILHLQDRLIHTLSGGERQLVALAGVLAMQPEVLLLDEPSIGLAPKLFQDLAGPIRALQQERKMSILIVEQNVREALKISDRVIVMKSGQLIREGSPEDFSNNTELMELY